MCLLKTKIPKELKTPFSGEALSVLLWNVTPVVTRCCFVIPQCYLLLLGCHTMPLLTRRFITSFTDLRYFFLPSGIFYLTLFPASFYHGILGPVVQPQNQQSFMLWFETQSRPKCLFESQQSTDLKYRRCFYI